MKKRTVDEIWTMLQLIDTYYIEDDEVPIDLEVIFDLKRENKTWKYQLVLKAEGDGGFMLEHKTSEHDSPDDAIKEIGTHFDQDGFYCQNLTPIKIGQSWSDINSENTEKGPAFKLGPG